MQHKNRPHTYDLQSSNGIICRCHNGIPTSIVTPLGVLVIYRELIYNDKIYDATKEIKKEFGFILKQTNGSNEMYYITKLPWKKRKLKCNCTFTFRKPEDKITYDDAMRVYKRILRRIRAERKESRQTRLIKQLHVLLPLYKDMQKKVRKMYKKLIMSAN